MCVSVRERGRKCLREDERHTCIGGGRRGGYIQTGTPRMDWGRKQGGKNKSLQNQREYIKRWVMGKKNVE